jgi:ribosomal protein L21E
MVDRTDELPGWYALQERLQATALSKEQINELKKGDVVRVHLPASVIPGNDARSFQGPIQQIKRYGTQEVLAIKVNGKHCDRALYYIYAAE